MPIEGSTCRCGKGHYYFNTYCGAYICDLCGDHNGLAQCFCGWNKHKADPEAVIQENWNGDDR